MRSNFRLGPTEKGDARSALVLLAGSGLTLTDAARLALLHREKRDTPLPAVDLSEAIRQFLADVRRRGRRTRTLEYYDEQLARLALSRLAEGWQRLDRKPLRAWLGGLGLSETSQGMVYRALRAFYRWAARHDPAYVARDPTEGWAPEKQLGSKTPQFYSVEDARKLLDTLPSALRPAVAVQLFAGLRPEEVAPRFGGKGRLAWADLHEAQGDTAVDPLSRAVRVSPEAAKTRRARIIEGFPPALWAWLGDPPTSGGDVWAASEQALRTALRSHFARVGVKWIRNGFRHTFATYGVAFTGDAAKVALWLGHEGSPRLLHTHYRGLATQAQGRAFFAIRPKV